MRVVTLPDGAVSANVLAAAGSPIFLGTTDLAGGSGAALQQVVEDTTLAPTALDTSATVTIATVNLTTTGNAMKITYTGILAVALGTGAQPDATFNVTIDGGGAPELDGEVGYTAPGAPATLQTTFGRTFWIFGQTPGAHSIVLTGDLSGTGTGATIAQGLQLSVEDWLFPTP